MNGEGTVVGGPDSAAPTSPACTARASEAWRLNREAMLLLGAGPRALLLQIAHPAVAAGVNDHSDFRADPWRRLRGTLRSYLTIVYGSAAAARGRDPAPEHAPSRDRRAGLRRARPGAVDVGPRHAHRVDAGRRATPGSSRFDRTRRARFYEETRPIGRAFGVPEATLPRDIEAFDAYWAEMLDPTGPVQVGPLARELAGVILRPPLPGALGRLPLPTAALRLDALAVGRAPATDDPGGVRPAVGCTAPTGVRLARGRVACLAPGAAGGLPPDASCPGRGPPARGAARALVDELAASGQHAEQRTEEDPSEKRHARDEDE